MIASWNLFWGILIILFGLSLLINAIFNIDLPLIKIFLGIMLIYAGFTLITGSPNNSFKKSFHQSINFGNRTIKVTDPKSYEKYTIMFGKGLFDFSKINLTDKVKIKINTVFGHSTILLNPNIPTRIVINSSFSNVLLPDKMEASFGEFVYKTGPADTEPLLEIKATVSFGNLYIQEGE